MFKKNILHFFRKILYSLVERYIFARAVRRPMRARLIYKDPLANYDARWVEYQLREAVNFFGKDVMIGDGVVIWGGRHESFLGIRLGDGVRLYDSCRLVVDHRSSDSGIVLGCKVAVNFNVYIEGSGGVEIGEGTIIGPNVAIVSSSHVIDRGTEVQESGKNYGKVMIGKNVWIGANVVVLKGVEIGDGAVIGAGSVVNVNVPAFSLFAGNPARFVRDI